MRRNWDAKCTFDQENDEKDMDRLVKCSDVKDCYNYDSGEYDSANCMPHESCAAFRDPEEGGNELHGCILTKYCD